MSTLTANSNKVHETSGKGSSAKSVKKSAKVLDNKQAEDFKQGLKEAIMISRGEMNGIPLSELWDE